MTPLPRPARRALAAALAALSLAACDDPAELAQEAIAARGECDQDSLRTSSEACVQMFERYAAMATDAIHSYIGGMKAMDQALDRMPPANFDTAGLGHAITLPLDSASAGWSTQGTLAPTPAYDAARLPRPRLGAFGDPGAGAYDGGAAAEWGAPAPPPSATSAPQRGVLRPPAERLDRPWLRRRADESDDGAPLADPRYADPRYVDPRYVDPRYADPRYGDPRYVDPRYGDPRYDPAYDERELGDPAYERPRPRPAPRKQ